MSHKCTETWNLVFISMYKLFIFVLVTFTMTDFSCVHFLPSTSQYVFFSFCTAYAQGGDQKDMVMYTHNVCLKFLTQLPHLPLVACPFTHA